MSRFVGAALCVGMLAACPARAMDAPRVLLAVDAVPAEVTAAEELRRGLSRIFGVDVPLVRGDDDAPAFRVGQSPGAARLLGGLDFATLRADEIILQTVGDSVIVAGDRPRGSLYAVYELLEREYGVGFWTATVEDWPTRGRFTLPQLDHRYAPPFGVREAFYDLIQRSEPFSVKMRNNGRYNRLPEAWGGHVDLLLWCHTFEKLLPPKTYFADHPEWFAERGGKRVATGQPCLTHPGARRQLTAATLAELRKHPGARIISVSQNDNSDYCQCAACTAFVEKHGNQSDLLIDAVNEVALAVAGEFPGVKVETLAYVYTRQPPKTVRPRANVIVRLCSIECDFSAPLDSEANARFAGEVRAWGALAPELYIWNYVTNFTKYYLPHPNLRNLAPDLRFFAAHGATAVFEQGSVGPRAIADFADLRAWLTSQLLWDPTRDARALTERFVHGYYGPAAPEVLAYLAMMDASLAPGSALGCYNNTTFWLDDARLLALAGLMDAAEAKAEEAVGDYAWRVREAAVSIRLALLERDVLWASDPALAARDWREMLERQIAVAVAAGTEKFTEHAPLSGVDVLRARFAIKHATPEGAPPAVAAGRPWKEVHAAVAYRSGEGVRSFVEDDAAAEGGKAVRMPNTHTAWASQARDLPDGLYDVYVELRCDSARPEGMAASAGIYNSGTKKTTHVEIPAADIAGKTYHAIPVGRAELTAHSSLFCAPKVNPSVENIWITRYLLVKAD